jgi:hypothetical protein
VRGEDAIAAAFHGALLSEPATKGNVWADARPRRPVIPGRERQRANPESSDKHSAHSGFRVRAYGAPRNDAGRLWRTPEWFALRPTT